MTQIHIVQRLAPGGIEQLVLSMAASADMHIISLEGRLDDLAHNWPMLDAFRGRITALGKKDGAEPGLVLRLAKAIAGLEPTSVVTHHAGPLLYGSIAARLAGVPRLAHMEHDAWHLEGAKRRRLVGGILRALRPQRYAVSAMVADAAQRHTGMDFRIIANGVDCNRFAPADKAAARRKAGLPLDRRIIGAAGRLEVVKGFDILVDAASHLPDDVTVVIWGDGSQRAALSAQIARLGLGERVLLAGRSADMASVYPALDLYCLPSRNEGLPLAVLEAQACGIPAVAHDVGGVREAICPATGSLLPLFGAANEMAGERLAALLVSRLDVPSTLNPRPFVEARFTLARTVSSYLNLGKA